MPTIDFPVRLPLIRPSPPAVWGLCVGDFLSSAPVHFRSRVFRTEGNAMLQGRRRI